MNIDNPYYRKNTSSAWWYSTRKTCPHCGHVLGFYKPKTQYVECSYCGNIVFRNKKAEFDFRIKRRFSK